MLHSNGQAIIHSQNCLLLALQSPLTYIYTERPETCYRFIYFCFFPYSKSFSVVILFFYVKLLLNEFCFPSIFEIYIKTSSYCLPTNRRGNHRIFFHDSFLFLKSKFLSNVYGTHYAAKG